MEYGLANITDKELAILEASDIEWYIHDIMSDEIEVVFESLKDCEKALMLIGRKEK